MKIDEFIGKFADGKKILDQEFYRKLSNALRIAQEESFDRYLLGRLDDIYLCQTRLALELNSVKSARILVAHLKEVTNHEFFCKHFPAPAQETFYWRWRGCLDIVEPLSLNLKNLPRYWREIKRRKISFEEFVRDFGNRLLGLINNQVLKEWLRGKGVVDELLKNENCEIIISQLSKDYQFFVLHLDELRSCWKDQVDIKTLSEGDDLKIVFAF